MIQEHLERDSEAKKERKFEPNQLILSVEEISSHKEGGVNGGFHTKIVFKSSITYLITSHEAGLKVVDNNNIVLYSGELPANEGYCCGPLYIDHLDSFLFAINGIFYQKEINEKPPFLFLSVGRYVGWYFSCPRYCPRSYRLVILLNRNSILIVDLDERRVEFRGRESFSLASDSEIFGQREKNNLIIITEAGLVLLYRLNYQMKKVVKNSKFQIPMIQSRGETGLTITVCDKHRYALAQLNADSIINSRVILLEIGKRLKLTIKGTLDRFEQQISPSYALSCCGYFGNHILWMVFGRLEREQKA